MIAYVKGQLAYTSDSTAVVDVGGIGYLINVSLSTLGQLPQAGKQVQLYTYLQTTESGQALHGFLSKEELNMFMLLISVSGIGQKVASGVLGTLTPQDIIMAIVADDTAALSRAPGVGKKVAARMLLELKDKIKTGNMWESTGGMAQAPSGKGGGSKQDAMDALLALGYGRTEAMQAIMEVAEEGMPPDAIIRFALKKLAR